MKSRVVLCTLALSALAVAPSKDKCPGPGPGPCKPVDTFEVNLDLPPRQRWTELIQRKKDGLLALLDVLRVTFKFTAAEATKELVGALNQSLPVEYLEEMQGIADAVEGVTLEDVIMANAFYEITGVANTPLSGISARSCTSMVAQRSNGTVFLARNQDYPPPFTLVMTHTVFTKGGAVQYEGTTYAGTIGLSTAMSHAAPGWAVSINARSNPDKGKSGCLERAVASANNGGSIFPILVRQAMDEAGGKFSDAVNYVATHPLIMPGYLIVGGANKGEGAIVTRNASISTANDSDVFSLFDARGRDEGGGYWYVVQTNTDHWKPAPIYPSTNTSRRLTATRGMDSVGADSVTLGGMWGVLSTSPTYNAATIHTDIVSPAWGQYETYKRHGPL